MNNENTVEPRFSREFIRRLAVLCGDSASEGKSKALVAAGRSFGYGTRHDKGFTRGIRLFEAGLVREAGIEPATGAWKALALPLRHSRTSL